MTQVTTSIVAVTVYPDRARITRRGKIKLSAGTYQLEVAELPSSLNSDSLRTSAGGTARAKVYSAQVKRTYFVETPSNRVREVEGEIEKLQDDMKAMDASTELVKQSRANLDKLASQGNIFATALASGEMSVEQQLAIYDGLRQRVEQLDREALSVQANRRVAERQLQKLTQELDQLRSMRPRERFSALVELEVLEAGDLTLEVSYVVNGAGWKPLYDMRLLESDGTPSLEVGYLAQVTQDTGEAWDDVSLSLSTARPALANTLPELDPWYISPPRRVVPTGGAMRAAPSPAALKVMANAEVSEPEQEYPYVLAQEALAEVDTAGISVTYAIPGATTIPPDGTDHKVTVARFSLTPEIDYVTAPKLEQAVYRRAKVGNDSPYTFLPGEANIFVVDEYIGTTRLEMIAPQGEIELYLGTEDRLKVERELKRRDIDKRIIGGKRHMVFAYEIELENLLAAQAHLTLHDQFPVPRHEEIKVRLESADPKPSEQTELNLLKWELSLEPKEKRTVRFDFSVEVPQGMEIYGLP